MTEINRKDMEADRDLGSFVAAMEHNTAMIEKMMHAMQEEALRFVNQRLECTGRALEGLRNCEGLTGMMAVHNEYIVGMARDYLDGSRRIGEVMRDFAISGVRDAQDAGEAATQPMSGGMERAAA